MSRATSGRCSASGSGCSGSSRARVLTRSVRTTIVVLTLPTFCKGGGKMRPGNEFAFLLTYWRRHILQEGAHGTRTLAPVVPPSARHRQGLPPEVRPVPAVGDRCGPTVGRS